MKSTPKRPRLISTPGTGSKPQAAKKLRVGNYGVIILYYDNCKEKEELAGFYYRREELAKQVRNSLIQLAGKISCAERAIFNENKILINCQDEETRDWIIESYQAVNRLKVVGTYQRQRIQLIEGF